MFRQLRNRIILMIMLATTSIVVVSFSLIYYGSAVSQRTRGEEMPVPREFRVEAFEDTFREAMRQEREERLRDLAVTLIAVGVGIELIMLLISYLYAEKAIQPVKQAYEQQREFIANASHELKTPIAAIRANFEALDSTEEPWTSNIDAELTHANQLVLDLLTLARTDDIATVTKRKKADLAKIVRDKVKVIEPRLNGKKISVDAPETIEIETYVSDFEQVLNILLDNAVKYSKSKIEVSLAAGTLTVKNNGKTIPKDKQEKIFERFYQVDKTANGTGLGLAIAKAVADKHRWQLAVESEKGWTEFKLRYK